MSKIVVTMAVYPSFEDLAKAMARFGEPLGIPPNPQQEGIHIMGFFDDGEPRTIQHACVVVIGDFASKWEVRDVQPGRTLRGCDDEIITVAFESGSIPLLVDGKETGGETGMHSLYAPLCRCVRIEKTPVVPEEKPKFPRYLMSITMADGHRERRFVPLREAGVTFDSGWARVEIVGLVLEADFSVRDVTPDERSRISEIAEEYSSSK